jgi:hypothetical protein
MIGSADHPSRRAGAVQRLPRGAELGLDVRHLAPFWCRQNIAEIVRRSSFGGVLPRGRTASINGSHTAQAASEKIWLPLPFVMPAT